MDARGTRRTSGGLEVEAFSRGAFLARSAVAVAGIAAGPAILSGCGGDGDESAAPVTGGGTAETAEELTTLGLQMVWIEGDTSMAGIWLGEDLGHFADRGLRLDPRPVVDVDPTQIVLAGEVPLGINGLPQLLAARAEGAPVKLLGAQFEKSPLCVTGRKDKGIETFEDLEGKRIGSDPASQLLLDAVLSVNGIGRTDYTYVTIGFDIRPILVGRIDAMLGFATNTPYLIELEEPDLETVTFVAADYNLPLVDYPYFSSEREIANHGDELTAFFDAAVRSWEAAIMDPSGAAEAVLKRQEGADPAQVRNEVTLLTEDFVSGPYDEEHGLFSVDPESIATVSEVLAQVGLISSEVVPEDLINDSFLPNK